MRKSEDSYLVKMKTKVTMGWGGNGEINQVRPAGLRGRGRKYALTSEVDHHHPLPPPTGGEKRTISLSSLDDIFISNSVRS